MEKGSIPESSFNYEQLEKYAKDLNKIYRAEKTKQKELDIAYRQLAKFAEDLNKNSKSLKIAHQELQEACLDTIQRLVLAAEYKDEDTGDHIIRMSRYCALISEKIGLPDDDVKNILYAAPMHDVGKIGIPDHILMKPGKLTDEEFNIIKTHTTIGAKILSDSKAIILKLSEEIALSHHEKWNGKGYPQGLSKTDIPVAGRIVGICDVFDALTTKRPYKDPFPLEKSVDIIKKERGEHFDPEIVDIFMKNMDEISKIKKEVASLEDSSLFGEHTDKVN